jgi:Protein of unknown function (DUF2933)
MAVKTGPIIGVAVAAAAVVALAAGVPVQRLLPWLLVLGCPLMMLFMHHGGHDRRAAHGGERTGARDEALPKKQ